MITNLDNFSVENCKRYLEERGYKVLDGDIWKVLTTNKNVTAPTKPRPTVKQTDNGFVVKTNGWSPFDMPTRTSPIPSAVISDVEDQPSCQCACHQTNGRGK